MSADSGQGPVPPARSMWTLWLILAVCVLPIVGSTVLYYLAPPVDRMNYGDLITPPKALPALRLMNLDGEQVNLGMLKGKWTMVQIDSAACASVCRDKLYKMRQVRLTQGKNMDRVQRLWVVSDETSVDEKVLRDYAGTVIVRAAGQDLGQLQQALPSSAAAEDHIWLVDPLGNVMLRYPPAADPSRMKNDLLRLLRVSRIE